MCTRTVGTLAHVLEAQGIATVALAIVRGQIEKVSPPRALYVDFPLGRPLGKPGDPAFQISVLDAAFALLAAPVGPVLEDFPESLGESEEMLACTIPPRFDPDAHPAVDEVLGLKAAYQRTLARTGRTSVGHAGGVDDIVGFVETFIALAEGRTVEELGLEDGAHLAMAMDLRSYYVEAALSLADHVPAARAAEAWLYDGTQLGEVLHAAQAQLHGQGRDRQDWYYLIPSTRTRL